jgi:hypothetical protein
MRLSGGRGGVIAVPAGLPFGALDDVLPPRLDPYVFGEPPVPGQRDGWPVAICPVHEVGSAAGCWMCAPP